MVPAQRRERARKFEATDRHRHALRLERIRNHLAQELRAGRRVIRRFDDDAIARGKHLDERPDAQVKRKIPRHDISDDALGLLAHGRPSGPEQRRIGIAFFVGHPRLQPTHGILRATRDAEHFDQVACRCRVRPEVLGKRLCDPRAVAHDHAGQRAEMPEAFLVRRIGIGEKGPLLCGERGAQRGDRGFVSVGGGGIAVKNRHQQAPLDEWARFVRVECGNSVRAAGAK